VVFSPDGKFVATASSDATTLIIDVEKGTIVRKLDKHKDTCNSVAYTKDGKTLVTCGDNIVNIWDAQSGELKKTLKPQQSGIIAELWSVAVSSDGKYVAAGGQDNIVKVWDLPKQ